jgi:hypothetical protein
MTKPIFLFAVGWFAVCLFVFVILPKLLEAKPDLGL